MHAFHPKVQRRVNEGSDICRTPGAGGGSAFRSRTLLIVVLHADQLENVKKYYRESKEAEERCKASVSGPSSPVERSKETRKRTEDLLKAKKDRFLRTVAAQKKSLDELQHKTHNLDKRVHHLSHKVAVRL